MNPKILAGLLLALLSSFPSKAQILNIDKQDTSDYVHHTRTNFNLNTGLEIDQQKQTLYDATNTAELMVQSYKELFIVAGSYRFTYNGPDDILNAGYLHLRWRHDYKNKIQPEPFIQYQWDNKRGIRHRALGGINARYNFWKGDKFDLNCGVGSMYEVEKWDYAAVDSAKIPVNAQPVENRLLKINSYVRLDWKISANSDVTFNVFLQTRPDRFQPRIAPHVQWDIKAGKHVGFSVAYTGLYDTRLSCPLKSFIIV